MSYLRRRDVRTAREALKRALGFGMVVSTLLVAVGAWRRFIVLGVNDKLWSVVAVVGVVGWVTSLVLPTVWKGPERLVARLAQKGGAVLFALLLGFVYIVLVTPVGWALRKTRGADPIYTWNGSEPRAMEGWRRKEVVSDAKLSRQASGRANLLRSFFGVLGFFARRGHYALLPVLVILLALGLVLFFVQSSALAPFIYTVF